MTDSDHAVRPPLGPGRRYTVQITLKPGDEIVEYRAAAMAALRLIRDRPDARFSTVEVVSDFKLDPEHDLRDYLGLE